jgi:hypothetical protein
MLTIKEIVMEGATDKDVARYIQEKRERKVANRRKRKNKKKHTRGGRIDKSDA